MAAKDGIGGAEEPGKAEVAPNASLNGMSRSGVVPVVSGLILGGDNRGLERDVGHGGRVAGTGHESRTPG